MIKAEDLRIGNYVFAFGKGQIQVKSIDEKFVNGNLQIHILKGIELTPEILEKCGFAHFEEFIYTINEEFKISIYGPIYYYNINGVLSPISNAKHLHQLQNLYFFLTGEELLLVNPVFKSQNPV